MEGRAFRILQLLDDPAGREKIGQDAKAYARHLQDYLMLMYAVVSGG